MSYSIYVVYKHNTVKILITKLSKSFIDVNKMRDKISELNKNKYKTKDDLTSNFFNNNVDSFNESLAKSITDISSD